MTRILDAARGDWTPAKIAPALLTLQLVLLWQVGLRGLDYVRSGDAPALDAGVASPALGWLLYGAAVLVLVGLAVRRAAAVILGEALVASWYLGLALTTLHVRQIVLGPYGYAGLAGSAAGVWLLLARGRSTASRFAGVAAMLGGQALLVHALGVDYRTSTAFLASGLVHGVLAVSTFVLWQRDRLSRYLDDLLSQEDAPCRTS